MPVKSRSREPQLPNNALFSSEAVSSSNLLHTFDTQLREARYLASNTICWMFHSSSALLLRYSRRKNDLVRPHSGWPSCLLTEIDFACKSFA